MEKTLSAIQKNYKIYLIVFLLWKLLPIESNGQKLSLSGKSYYRQIFQEHYDDALQFISNNRWMADSLKVNSVDPNFALAIIFPELIRYSSIQDKMEMSGLLTLYVQYGEKYANFSVGRFQMKPTFAEQLEKDANNIKSQKGNAFNQTNTSEVRMERVKRLDDIYWQVKYLALFIKVMNSKYRQISWNSEEEKLKFYATAYNSGYSLCEEIINKRIGSDMFYTGIVKGNSCYNYADIAADYYSGARRK
jgi:hypothetical protein